MNKPKLSNRSSTDNALPHHLFDWIQRLGIQTTASSAVTSEKDSKGSNRIFAYDLFISHASEDKDIFVRPLATELRNSRVEVWYDEFSLRPGDSLRRSIDRGLSKSRYGIVVLSHNFFKRRWTEWELDGLVSRQQNQAEKIIIPIWLDVNIDDILEYSPSLADKIAIDAKKGINAVVNEVLRIIRPEGSALLFACEIAEKHGLKTPAITDDWWIDVIEFSSDRRNAKSYPELGWKFPLPPDSNEPKRRGIRLAWAAMMRNWMEKAERERILPNTHPDCVHEFINVTPGLKEMCIRSPEMIGEIVPQLVIPEFSGDFAPGFDAILRHWVYWYRGLRSSKFKKPRSARSKPDFSLSNDSIAPYLFWDLEPDPEYWNQFLPDVVFKEDDECVSVWAMRHPNYLTLTHKTWIKQPKKPVADFNINYLLAFDFFGRRNIDHIDFLVWLLSDASNWLPGEVRKNLLYDFSKNWQVWGWGKYDDERSDSGFQKTEFTGSLYRQLETTTNPDEIKLTSDSYQDLVDRLSFSAMIFSLPESGSELAERFLSAGLCEAFWNLIHKDPFTVR